MTTTLTIASRQTGSANQRRSFGEQSSTIMGFHVFADPWNPIVMKRNEITLQLLRSRLDYDPSTGIFVRRINMKRYKAGSVSGRIDSHGYIILRVGANTMKGHRAAWLYMTGRLPIQDLDHINGNRSDNRFENLREATRGENLRNAKKRSDNTSGIKGVFWDKLLSKWRVSIRHRGKLHHLGCFQNIKDAEHAAKAGREKLHGEFANHG